MNRRGFVRLAMSGGGCKITRVANVDSLRLANGNLVVRVESRAEAPRRDD